MLDERWSKIMQEVDRRYHINQTSEGRINCITDYIIRLLNEQAAQQSVQSDGRTPPLTQTVGLLSLNRKARK